MSYEMLGDRPFFRVNHETYYWSDVETMDRDHLMGLLRQVTAAKRRVDLRGRAAERTREKN